MFLFLLHDWDVVACGGIPSHRWHVSGLVACPIGGMLWLAKSPVTTRVVYEWAFIVLLALGGAMSWNLWQQSLLFQSGSWSTHFSGVGAVEQAFQCLLTVWVGMRTQNKAPCVCVFVHYQKTGLPGSYSGICFEMVCISELCFHC